MGLIEDNGSNSDGYSAEIIPFEPDPDHTGVGSGGQSEINLSHILFG
jgi:hypothetical protein